VPLSEILSVLQYRCNLFPFLITLSDINDIVSAGASYRTVRPNVDGRRKIPWRAFYDERAGVLFSGDTLFQGDQGRTDLPGGNEALIQQSLKRLLSMNEKIVACPGQGPVTTIGEERD